MISIIERRNVGTDKKPVWLYSLKATEWIEDFLCKRWAVFFHIWVTVLVSTCKDPSRYLAQSCESSGRRDDKVARCIVTWVRHYLNTDFRQVFMFHNWTSTRISKSEVFYCLNTVWHTIYEKPHLIWNMYRLWNL